MVALAVLSPAEMPLTIGSIPVSEKKEVQGGDGEFVNARVPRDNTAYCSLPTTASAITPTIEKKPGVENGG
jgi:hypothetical protein